MTATIFVPEPHPGETCPGLPLWQRHGGEDWLVFMDESFFMFWEMTARSGYFGHAAVGVPEKEYRGLVADVEPILRDFVQLTGQSLTEFKHAEFRRLEYRHRRRLALRLRDALTAHSAFIAGYYTPARSFALESVRIQLMDDGAEELPEDHEALVEAAARDLRAAHSGPGQSGTLWKLLLRPVMGVANLLASLGCNYKVICDPRQKQEDKAVGAVIADIINRTGNVRNVPDTDLRDDLDLHFRGVDFSRTSDQEMGLQLADLMVGEVCAFFKANDDLLSFAAARRLVTPTSEEPVNTVTRLDGRFFKTGALHRMPADLRARCMRPDPQGRTVLPFFRNLFASGTLTCYSAFGQPRHLMVFEGVIVDQSE